MNTVNQKKTVLKKKIFREFKEYWLSVFYMAFFFAIFSTYRRLILAHYDISYQEYGISLIKALVLAKIVLVVEQFHIGQDYFKDKPLIVPTVIKTVIFVCFATLFNIIESMSRSFLQGRDAVEAIHKVINHFNYEWLASALVVFFFFLPFCAIRELRTVMGEGTLSRLYFQTRSAVKHSHNPEHNT